MFISKYYITNTVIGEGSNSRLYLAYNTETGAHLAAKAVPAASEASVLCAVKEARILLTLRGIPNITQLVNVISCNCSPARVCTEKCRMYMFYKLVSGSNLADLLMGGVEDRYLFIQNNFRLDESVARAVFLSVATTVHNLHTNFKIAHLDIKLENIMLDILEKKLILVDFGFSEKLTKNLTQRSGSLHYCAPEVYYSDRTTEGYEGKGADVWSLGTMLYILLTNQFPFDYIDKSNSQENTPATPDTFTAAQIIFEKKLNESYIEFPYFSPGVRAVLKGMLTSDPKKRWTLDRVLSHEWSLSLDLFSDATDEDLIMSLVRRSKHNFGDTSEFHSDSSQ